MRFERRHSRVEWIVLYLAAGVVGELVGIGWQPHGAGNSVAALGLAGALALDAIRRRDPSLLALGYAALVLVTLIGADVGGIVGVVVVAVAYVLPGATVAATRAGAVLPGWFTPALGGSTLGLGAVLVALENIHGPALLAGAVVALMWTTVVRDRVAARTARTPRPG